MKNIRLYVWIILGGLFLSFPLWAKFITKNPLIFPPEDNPLDWLIFFAQYLCAIASFAMIVVTATSLKLNRDELNEMKRQWDEEHRPNVSVSYSQIGYVASLRLVNTSNVEIRNLTISAAFYYNEEKNDFFNLGALENFFIDIEPHGVRNIILSNQFDLGTDEGYFDIHLSYNGEHKDVKVYCSNLYVVGDSFIEDIGKRK